MYSMKKLRNLSKMNYSEKIRIDDLNILRNLSEIEATRTIIDTFKKKLMN